MEAPPTLEELRSLSRLVSSALQQKSKGVSRQYSMLVQQLQYGTDGTLRRLFLALGRCASELGRTPALYEDLVSIAFSARFRPVTQDDLGRITAGQAAVARQAQAALGAGGTAAAAATALQLAPAAICTLETAEAQAAFAIALVGSNPLCFLPAAKALIRALATSQTEADAYAAMRARGWAITSAAVANNGEEASTTNVGTPSTDSMTLPPHIVLELSSLLTAYHRLIYAAVGELLTLVPTAAPSLASVIAETTLPHRRVAATIQMTGARHMLQLASRLPILRDRLVAVLVDRALELDLDIPLELLPDEDEEDEHFAPNDIKKEEKIDQGMESDSSMSSIGDMGIAISARGSPKASTSTNQENSTQPPNPAVVTAIENAEKLDGLFLLIVRFIHAHMCGCGSLSHHTSSTQRMTDSTRSKVRNDSAESETSMSASSATSDNETEGNESNTNSNSIGLSIRVNNHNHSTHPHSILDDTAATYTPRLSLATVSTPSASPILRLPDLAALEAAGLLTEPLYVHGQGLRPLPDPILDGDAGRSGTCITLTRMMSLLHPSPINNETPGNETPSEIMKKLVPLSATAERLFALVLGLWERCVMPAHRSKFTQFLLFYAASFHPGAVDRFVGRLITQLQAPDRPLLTRVTCASYLGSFLARAAVVGDSVLMTALHYMLLWSHGYADLWAVHAQYTLKCARRLGEKAVRELAAVVEGAYPKIVRTKHHRMVEDEEEDDDTSSSVSANHHEEDSVIEDGFSYNWFGNDNDDDDDEQAGMDGQLPEPPLNPPPIPFSLLQFHPTYPRLPPPELFHATMQSAFYICVFRAAHLRQRAGGIEFLRSLHWGPLLAHRVLDPLSKAAPAVAQEFVRVAHALRLASHAEMSESSAYADLTRAQADENDSISSSSDDDNEEDTDSEGENSDDTSSVATVIKPAPKSRPILAAALAPTASIDPTTSTSAPVVTSTLLETFFPFDPFLLKRSSAFVSGVYRSWTASRLPASGDWLETTDGYDTATTGAIVGLVPSSAGGYVSAASRGGRHARHGGTSGAESATGFIGSDSDGHRRRHSRRRSNGLHPIAEGNEHRLRSEDDDSSQDSSSTDSQDDDEDNTNASVSSSSSSEDQTMEDHDGVGAGGGGLLARLRSSLGVGPPGSAMRMISSGALTSGITDGMNTNPAHSSWAGSLAPGLAAMVADAGDTEDLLAGLDIGLGENLLRRSSSGTLHMNMDTDIPSHSLAPIRSTSNESNVNRFGNSRSVHDIVPPSPTVSRLRSKLRGLSFDESAYYASLAGGSNQERIPEEDEQQAMMDEEMLLNHHTHTYENGQIPTSHNTQSSSIGSGIAFAPIFPSSTGSNSNRLGSQGSDNMSGYNSSQGGQHDTSLGADIANASDRVGRAMSVHSDASGSVHSQSNVGGPFSSRGASSRVTPVSSPLLRALGGPLPSRGDGVGLAVTGGTVLGGGDRRRHSNGSGRHGKGSSSSVTGTAVPGFTDAVDPVTGIMVGEPVKAGKKRRRALSQTSRRSSEGGVLSPPLSSMTSPLLLGAINRGSGILRSTISSTSALSASPPAGDFALPPSASDVTTTTAPSRVLVVGLASIDPKRNGLPPSLAAAAATASSSSYSLSDSTNHVHSHIITDRNEIPTGGDDTDMPVLSLDHEDAVEVIQKKKKKRRRKEVVETVVAVEEVGEGSEIATGSVEEVVEVSEPTMDDGNAPPWGDFSLMMHAAADAVVVEKKKKKKKKVKPIVETVDEEILDL